MIEGPVLVSLALTFFVHIVTFVSKLSVYMYLQDLQMKGFRDPHFKGRYHSLIHAHVKGMFPTKQYYCSHYEIFAEVGD